MILLCAHDKSGEGEKVQDTERKLLQYLLIQEKQAEKKKTFSLLYICLSFSRNEKRK